MSEFPQNIDKVLNNLAKEHRIKIGKETHYDALNREISWLEKNILKRIDLTLVGEFVDVTFYIDTFPFCPKLFIWCRNYIPMFPYLAKGAWKELGKLPLEETEDYYHEKIKSYIDYAIKQ